LNLTWCGLFMEAASMSPSGLPIFSPRK
jgi:hypothetical protein